MDTPLIGISSSIEKIRELIKYVADSDLNVLITGESGVGKEVVANSNGALLQDLIEIGKENLNSLIRVLYS